jgi:hypothetical protein
MIAAVPNVIGWLAISFAKVRFNYHLFSFHAPAFFFASYSVVIVLLYAYLLLNWFI